MEGALLSQRASAHTERKIRMQQAFSLEVEAILQTLLERYPPLKPLEEKIRAAYLLLYGCCRQRGLVLVCGNGGSAADSEHIVGELMKGFVKRRPLEEGERRRFSSRWGEEGEELSQRLQGAIPALSLVSQTALMTAFCNDEDPQMVFAQQVYGYSRLGIPVLLIGLSTSGSSANVVNAVKTAAALGMQTVGITGSKGGAMASLCDVSLALPVEETYQVQELTLPVYHALCAMAEAALFKE